MQESEQSKVVKLSEAITKKSFEKLDWQALRAHLEAVGLDEATLDELLGHLRRASGFIHRYPNKKVEGRRDAFLGKLRRYVGDSRGESAARRVTEEVDLLRLAERGYREILATLDAAEVSKLLPEVRVAAYLRFALQAYSEVMQQHEEMARKHKQLTFPNDTFVPEKGGTPISVDAVVQALVAALSTSLIMESHKQRWHDDRGIVTLPRLPEVGEAETFQAGSTQALAICWGRWQRTEERRRFLGGKLEQFAAPGLPGWAPTGATTATLYTPEETEFFDYAANERVLDRLGQQYMEMVTETQARHQVSGIAQPVGLMPAGFVSLRELHAAASLGDILKYEVTDDTERPGGLRFVEWLRGYAVLQQLADDAHQGQRGEAGLTTILSRPQLLSILERCGLTPPSAEHFIAHATLKTSSEDLFDTPLLQLHDDRLMVFGPALLTANLTVVVLSTLATLGESFSRKGRSLEAAVVNLLEEQQLHARGFKVTRDGQEYEYDAVLIWGDYVFVFECKNHSLSGNRPVSAYYFELGIRSAVRQVKRLVEALRKYPDILQTQMQVTLGAKTIVPCVLNSLPYARSGDIDGVYCTDSSILERFFSQPHLTLKSPFQLTEKTTVLHRIRIASFWQGDKPRPEDLLKQLREPFQLKLLQAHTELRPRSYPLSPTHSVMVGEFARTPWSIDSVTNAFGVPADGVHGIVDLVHQQLRAVKRRAAKKQTRPKKHK